jgi:hypothetical protein
MGRNKIKSISVNSFTAMNEYAHSTRKATVGDLSTLIFPEYLAQSNDPSPSDWKEYYLNNCQEKYYTAIGKLLSKFEDVKKAVNSITEQEIKS